MSPKIALFSELLFSAVSSAGLRLRLKKGSGCASSKVLPVRFSTAEVKSNGELLVADSRAEGFLVMRWLLVTSGGSSGLLPFFFAERATVYISIHTVFH